MPICIEHESKPPRYLLYVFQLLKYSFQKDCREKPMIPVSDTQGWMSGQVDKQRMDLKTTNCLTFPTHPVKKRETPHRHEDHTSTFLDTKKAMKGNLD